MGTAAKIEIKLEAHTAQLKKGFAETRRSIDGLGKGLSGNVAMGLAKFHVGMMLAKAAIGMVRVAITQLVSSLATMDTAAKSAATLGITADSLTALGFAAEQSGSSQEKLTQSLTQLGNRVSDAAQGIGDGKKALDELGLSAAAMVDMPVDQQMAIIADAMQGVESQSDKVRIAMDLFGRSGVGMLNMLEGGSAGLNAFAAEADELGLSLGTNREEAEKVSDAINRMKRAWGGLVAKLAVAVAPALTAISNILAGMVAGFNRIFASLDNDGAVKFKSLAEAGDKVKSSLEAGDKALAAATEKAEKLRAAFASAGEAITKSLQTPIERARDTVESLRKHLVANTISLATYQRGVDKAVKGLMSVRQAMATPSVGAVTRTSTAGFSAVQKAQRDRDKQMRLAEARNKRLDEILLAIRAGDVVLAPMEI